VRLNEKLNFQPLNHRTWKYIRVTKMSQIFALMFVAFHLVGAFEVEDCPGDCHCMVDGLQMIVDCAGLDLTELPEFPDNQARQTAFMEFIR
jgi:hypothetical protein